MRHKDNHYYYDYYNYNYNYNNNNYYYYYCQGKHGDDTPTTRTSIAILLQRKVAHILHKIFAPMSIVPCARRWKRRRSPLRDLTAEGPAPSATTYSYSGSELAAPIEDLRPSHRAAALSAPTTTVACRPTHLMSSAEQQVQAARFRAILQILNVNGTELAARGWQCWVQTFGELGNERHTMFGEYVFRGMAAWFQNQYIHRHRMATPEELTIGWFQLPAHFSRAAAAAPATEHDVVFYPAIFSETWVQGNLVPMACLHIVVMSSRPWYVHVSRAHSTRTLRIVLC